VKQLDDEYVHFIAMSFVFLGYVPNSMHTDADMLKLHRMTK